MNTRDLEAFIAVVDSGSIVAASAKLNLTQPGVTRRIQSLETHLGAVLLDRNAKPLKPTQAGRGAYDVGRRVLQGIEDLRGEVTPGQAVRGELRLGIATYLPERELCDSIDTVRGLFPDLSLRVVAAWSPRLIDQVQRGELDAASICLPEGTTPPDTLVAEDLGARRAFFIASPQLTIPPAPRLRDLAGHPWVVSEDGCGFRGVIRRKFEAEHLPFTIAVEAVSLDLRMTLIARGLGIGIATSRAAGDSRWVGVLNVVDVPDFRPRVRCWLVYRQSLGRLDSPLRVFRDAIAKNLHDVTLRDAA